MLNYFSSSSATHDARIRNNLPLNENQIKHNTTSNSENEVSADENDDTIEAVWIENMELEEIKKAALDNLNKIAKRYRTK